MNDLKLNCTGQLQFLTFDNGRIILVIPKKHNGTDYMDALLETIQHVDKYYNKQRNLVLVINQGK